MPKKYALDEAQDFEHRLEDEKDLPPDEQTVFVLRSLVDRDRQEVWNALVRGNDVEIELDAKGRPTGSEDGRRVIRIDIKEQMEAHRLAVGKALQGWRNFTRKGGVAVPFPGSGARATYALSEDTIREIGMVVLERSRLAGEDAGN